MMNQRESIESAQKEAKSDLAKFIFDPKNREAFYKILNFKPASRLVAELNAESHYPQDDLNELKTITADWKIHRELFALPPEKILDIILKRGLLQENLNLIRPLLEEKGAFNNLFRNILRIDDLHEQAKLFHRLANSSEMHEREIKHFLYTIRTPINNFQFKEQYLRCYSLLKKTNRNNSTQPPIETLLNYQSRNSNDETVNELVDQQINAAQTILKEWINILLKQTLIKLMKSVDLKPTSNVTQFVFDPKNLEKMAAIIVSEPLEKLLPKLNSLNVSKEKLDQLNIFSSNQNDYPLLFKIPAFEWLKILTEEKIESQDLTSLIGSDGMGAVSGLLDEINELPDILDRARAFNYLLNSRKESNDSIRHFFESLGLPEANKDSFFRLHHIVHNLTEYVPEEEEAKFDSDVPHRTSIECVLGITPPSYADRVDIEETNKNNSARINAASKITIECVKALLEKNKLALDEKQLKKFNEEKDALFAKELQNEHVPDKKKITNYNDPMIFFIRDNPDLFQDFIGNLRQIHTISYLDDSIFLPTEEKEQPPPENNLEDVELQKAILLSLGTSAEEEKREHLSPSTRIWK